MTSHRSLLDGGGARRTTQFSDLEIYAVETLLREVWGLLCADAAWLSKARQDFEERQYSEAIALKIDELVRHHWDEHPILAVLSQTIDVGPIYDAKSTSKQKLKAGQPVFDTVPDFYFRRPTRPGLSPLTHGLFIEAKIIDSRRNMGNYCGTGLSRFVQSLYAWNMSQAIMLGYVRGTKHGLPKSLARYLATKKNRRKYHVRRAPAAVALSTAVPPMHDSIHGRPKAHPETGRPSEPITVAHLWLAA
ncbi:MAG: hypothetical protein U1F54_04835 [Burkholderiales bacterium]